ncbi:hypothetical protein GPECTOR_618g707 [Gonium pectorale]|uniref:Uncharacterized protein n=1 Tax=Gonium pectorale TaxID=33097 RepID=A0A150FW32_GONPE|nr:hypothetical protein GPECTOR_618g707 [Gonium pectorale]|eukprot:KXZ41240.1 hypothetical protein GPECTOR_618g707 [Gonium pectorale]
MPGFLCCFKAAGSDSTQQPDAGAENARAELSRAATALTPGRGTPVAMLPHHHGGVGMGMGAHGILLEEGAEDERRSSPLNSRKLMKLPEGAPRDDGCRGLWALSSDGTVFVAQASGGPARGWLRPGATAPAALGERRGSSLQRVQASKMSEVFTAVPAAPRPAAMAEAAVEYREPTPLTYDLAELAAAGGGSLTDFAVLPLLSGGEVVGAVTLAVHRSHMPPQRRGRSNSSNRTSNSRSQSGSQMNGATAAAGTAAAATRSGNLHQVYQPAAAAAAAPPPPLPARSAASASRRSLVVTAAAGSAAAAANTATAPGPAPPPTAQSPAWRPSARRPP